MAAAPAAVQVAYQTYLHPPKFELYDLETDPNEFRNLAEDAAHQDVRERLVEQLHAWRIRTQDPQLDPVLFAEHVARQEQAVDGVYRKSKGFRWPYLDSWRP